jgi:hypothetical protein
VPPAACGPSFPISEPDRLCVASRSPPPGDWKSDGGPGGEIPRGIMTIDSRREPTVVSTSAGALPTSGRGGSAARSLGEGGTAGASGIGGDSTTGGSAGAGGATGGGASAAGGGPSATGGSGSADGGCAVGGSGAGGSAVGGSGAGGSAVGGSGAGGSAVGGSGGSGSVGGCSGAVDSGGTWSWATPTPVEGSTAEETSPEEADPSSARASAASTRPRSVAKAHTARRAAQLACAICPVTYRGRQSAAVGRVRIIAASSPDRLVLSSSASHSLSDMSTQIYGSMRGALSDWVRRGIPSSLNGAQSNPVRIVCRRG